MSEVDASTMFLLRMNAELNLQTDQHTQAQKSTASPSARQSMRLDNLVEVDGISGGFELFGNVNLPVGF